jgi:hypothetical protein
VRVVHLAQRGRVLAAVWSTSDAPVLGGLASGRIAVTQVRARFGRAPPAA